MRTTRSRSQRRARLGRSSSWIGSASPPSCQEEAAGTLMNLAASDANKSKIMSAGAVAPLVALLTSGTDATKEHSAGALANIANGHDDNQDGDYQGGAIDPLLTLPLLEGLRGAGRLEWRCGALGVRSPPPRSARTMALSLYRRTA